MAHATSSRLGRAAVVAAALALGLTACSGAAPVADPNLPPEGSSAVVTNGGDTVALVGTAALKWEPPTATAASGEVTFQLESLGATHNVIIEGVNGDEPIVEAEADETVSVAITLEPGTYTFFCNVTGHRAAGMEGTLTVS